MAGQEGETLAASPAEPSLTSPQQENADDAALADEKVSESTSATASKDGGADASAEPNSLPSSGQTMSADEVQGKALELLKQLEGNKKQERDLAEKMLMELGPAVLPWLPKVDRKMPAETVERLERVRTYLEKAASSSTFQGSMITLKMDNAPVSQVLEALGKQSGNTLVDYRGEFEQEAPDPSISVDFANVPFWQALDETLDEAALEIYDYPADRGTLAYIAKQPNTTDRKARAFYSGPFRLTPLRIESLRSLRGSENEVLKLTLQLAWEPRLSPIGISIPYDSLVILDEKGEAQDLRPTEQENNRLDVTLNPETPQIDLELQLKLPPRSLTSLSVVRGNLQTTLLGEMHDFDFDDVMNKRNLVKKIGAAQVTMRMSRRPAPSALQVFLDIQFDNAGEALESYQGWIYSNPAKLITAGGEVLEAGGVEEIGRGENGVGMSYLFEVPQDQVYRLNYRSAASIGQVPFSFEIKDLPLP